METFFEIVSQFVQLSGEAREAMVEVLKPLELPKAHVLVRRHTVCNHVYFVEQGLTRTWYYKDEKDITDWFSPENTFACSILSFISRQPDRREIELLEPSRLWSLSYDDLEDLYRRYHDVERFGRLLVSMGLVQVQQRFDELHFSTASERYQNLMQTNPSLIQRAPLGMIATYLGITPETLSRIRAQK